jgi:hypothetical protein
MEIVSNTARENSKRKHRRVAGLLEFVVVVILSGLTFYEYLRNEVLQSYVKNAIDTNAPVLQFALPVGVVAIGASIFLQRRRDMRENRAALWREQLLANIKFGDAVLPHADTLPHHQIFFDSQPRDDSFIIRKTNKKGRLSRVRDAEKLPPGESS